MEDERHPGGVKRWKPLPRLFSCPLSPLCQVCASSRLVWQVGRDGEAHALAVRAWSCVLVTRLSSIALPMHTAPSRSSQAVTASLRFFSKDERSCPGFSSALV